jgi:small subunit ribosomal protein S9
MSPSKIIAQAVGRRKRAVASVRLISGKSEITVNGQPVAKYFPGLISQFQYQRPFTTLSLTKYSASVKVAGGGPASQLEATVLALSKCLASLKPEYKTSLRGADLLTRDSRKRQRRMVGMGGKSRRKRQSPKR